MLRAAILVILVTCLTGCSTGTTKRPHVVGFDPVGSSSWWAYMNK